MWITKQLTSVYAVSNGNGSDLIDIGELLFQLYYIPTSIPHKNSAFFD